MKAIPCPADISEVVSLLTTDIPKSAILMSLLSSINILSDLISLILYNKKRNTGESHQIHEYELNQEELP